VRGRKRQTLGKLFCALAFSFEFDRSMVLCALELGLQRGVGGFVVVVEGFKFTDIRGTGLLGHDAC
jgi:hypothetical protein